MRIAIEDDFDLGRIADSGQCFRWTRMDDGSYRILQGCESLRIRNLGGGVFDFGCTEEQFNRIWSGYFDLDENYRAIRERVDSEVDQALWCACECEKGIRILRQDLWEVLVSFIISQNRNIPAIKRSIELLADLAGPSRTDALGCDYRGFPDAEAIARLSERQLTQCALGYRAKYVLAAARAVSSGEFNREALAAADDEEAVARLCELYGVGVKVASCVALFGLHRLDAFPQDVWIKRILASEYPDGYPFDLYSPYNGVYQQYLFAYFRNGG